MLASYPKVWNLGHPHIADLFLDDVTIEEKIDGSQFSFGVVGGVLKCRSKGVELLVDAPDQMFAAGVHVARELAPNLKEGWVYRGEYLRVAHHNALAYDRIPKQHIVLFDIMTGMEEYASAEAKTVEAERLGLECVPVFYSGRVAALDEFKSLLDRTSMLGGAKMEGVVIKSRTRFGKDGKPLFGKYVSEAFREVHKSSWKEKNPGGKDIVQILIAKYRHPGRWTKAVQHLREAGKLQNDPKDIGALMKEFHLDLEAECSAEIAETLLKWALADIKRGAARGLPEWYKEQLAKAQFGEAVGIDK